MVLKSKNRGKKIPITDVAIKKVPYINFFGKDESENLLLQKASVLVLTLSKYNNDSNEVALTLDLSKGAFNLKLEEDSDLFGVSFGSEHEVDVLADTRSYHIVNSADKCAVALSHNHPSTQTFSLEDISFFLAYASVGVFIVVSNQGAIHYLQKTDKYDYNNAYRLFKYCSRRRKLFETRKDFYQKSLKFLRNCSKCGILYK